MLGASRAGPPSGGVSVARHQLLDASAAACCWWEAATSSAGSSTTLCQLIMTVCCRQCAGLCPKEQGDLAMQQQRHVTVTVVDAPQQTLLPAPQASRCSGYVAWPELAAAGSLVTLHAHGSRVQYLNNPSTYQLAPQQQPSRVPTPSRTPQQSKTACPLGSSTHILTATTTLAAHPATAGSTPCCSSLHFIMSAAELVAFVI